MITDKKWEPTQAFEVPLTLTDSPDVNQKNPLMTQEKAESHVATQVQRTETVSDDDSSTSSMAWGNKSDGLSEVDIADLYCGED